jgi:hypothetical protein
LPLFCGSKAEMYQCFYFPSPYLCTNFPASRLIYLNIVAI